MILHDVTRLPGAARRKGDRIGRLNMKSSLPHPNPAGEMFDALHAGLEVKLIATPRQELKTCRPDDLVSDAVRRNVEHYNYIPVVDESELIIGLFHAAKYRQDSSSEALVRNNFRFLSEDFIIGGDTSILEFVKDADTRPCRLVVSGSNIVGLVSLSDLQRFPVRAVLFALITGFEITMMEAVRRLYKDEAVWLAMLKPERRDKIEKEKADAQAMDSFVDTLLFAQFADKKTILEKHGLEGRSRSELKTTLGRIERLRNKIAHANEYATTPAQARQVCATVRDLLKLRPEISGL
jgi:CBS domain-containing protein